MFNGVTAFLEAMDQTAEKLAEDGNLYDEERASMEHLERQRRREQELGEGVSLFRKSSTDSIPSTTSGRRVSAAAGGVTPSMSSAQAGTSFTTAAPALSSSSHVMMMSPLPKDLNLETLKLHCIQLRGALTHEQERRAAAEATLAERNATLDTSTARLAAAEQDVLRLKRETAYYQEQASTSRGELAKHESDLRVLKDSYDELGKELLAYRESSRLLLEAKEAEIRTLKDQQLGGSDSAVTRSPALAKGSVTSEQYGKERAELLEQMSSLKSKLASAEADAQQHHREAEGTKREVHNLGTQNATLKAQAEQLGLDCRASQESLEGEALAHAETRASLRRLQAQFTEAQYSATGISSKSIGGGVGEMNERSLNVASSAATLSGSTEEETIALLRGQLARHEEEFAEVAERERQTSYQLMKAQAALEASTRDIAEWKTRYGILVRRVGDEEVASAAGYGAGKDSMTTRIRFPGPVTGGGGTADTRHASLHYSGSAGEAAGAADGNSAIVELKRVSRVMKLARVGKGGRVLAAVLFKMDETTIRLGRLLQVHPVARVALVCYVVLLQFWIVALTLFMNTSSSCDPRGTDGVA